jgi:endonuclease G
LVPTKSADYRNYKKSGYDKGHLCRAGDRNFNKEAFDETFYTSNISPQKHDFNSGIWNTLEQKVSYWAIKYESIYVVTGGILNTKLQTIGPEKVAVP